MAIIQLSPHLQAVLSSQSCVIYVGGLLSFAPVLIYFKKDKIKVTKKGKIKTTNIGYFFDEVN